VPSPWRLDLRLGLIERATPHLPPDLLGKSARSDLANVALTLATWNRESLVNFDVQANARPENTDDSLSQRGFNDCDLVALTW
jgi:hypothetical protein